MAEIRSFRDLNVYEAAREAVRSIFEVSKAFPRDERYSLTDQIRRSSRAVNAMIAEAWAKRRYEPHFVSKLTDCDGEANETDSSLDFARDCSYISDETHRALVAKCTEVRRMLGGMIKKPGSFIITQE